MCNENEGQSSTPLKDNTTFVLNSFFYVLLIKNKKYKLAKC